MRSTYYALAGGATLFASALLVLQIVGGLEYTHGASAYTQASMVTAMVAVAALPLFVHAAWHVNKMVSAVLFVGFMALLVYSMPANIGRIGEVREVKALAAGDAAKAELALKDIATTLSFAEPAALRECAGAPDPLPPSGWPECRRKRASVDALLNERKRLTAEIRSMGSERVGDVGSETLAWAFGFAGISAATIRKGSGMAFAVGLEISIFALSWLAATLITKAGTMVPRQAVTERDLREEPLTESEVEELRRLLRSAGRPLSNQEVADALRVSHGEASKRVKDAVAAGLVQKIKIGRHVAISPTVH